MRSPVVRAAAAVALAVLLTGCAGAADNTRSLPSPGHAVTVAEPLDELSADPGKVAAAVSGALSDPALGSRVEVHVADEDSDLFTYGAAAGTPASTTKLLTGLASLATLGPDRVFTTKAVRDAGRIVVVGGGDPLFDDDQLEDLARQTVTSLQRDGLTTVTVGYDTSLFSGPGEAASWKPTYVTERTVAPISSLWLDEGHTNAAGQSISKVPADQVAAKFAQLLTANGIAVDGTPQPAQAPGDGDVVASVESKTLAQILKWTLEYSDNDAAEVIARHVAIERKEAATFDGAAKAVVDTVAEQGVDVQGVSLYDGSGLSRSDAIPTATLVDVLRTADREPGLRVLLTSLGVAGFTGTVSGRFDDLGGALGNVRAKTGGLNNVRALAGTAETADGATVYFAVIADGITLGHELEAEKAIDRLVASIAGCACRADG